MNAALFGDIGLVIQSELLDVVPLCDRQRSAVSCTSVQSCEVHKQWEVVIVKVKFYFPVQTLF